MFQNRSRTQPNGTRTRTRTGQSFEYEYRLRLSTKMRSIDEVRLGNYWRSARSLKISIKYRKELAIFLKRVIAKTLLRYYPRNQGLSLPTFTHIKWHLRVSCRQGAIVVFGTHAKRFATLVRHRASAPGSRLVLPTRERTRRHSFPLT